MNLRVAVPVAIVAVLAGAFLLAPDLALAQPNLNNLKVNVIESGNLLTLVGRLIQQFLLIIGILAFLYLLWAGFNYVTAGGDDGKVKQARQTIVNVVIGIIIITFSYVLVLFVIQFFSSSTVPTPAPTAEPTTPPTARPRNNTSGSGTTGTVVTPSPTPAFDPRDII